MEEFIIEIKHFFDEFESMWQYINKQETVQLTNKKVKDDVNKLAAEWFSKYSKKLLDLQVENTIIDKYNKAFRELLKLSTSNSRRSSYIKNMELIRRDFNTEVIIFLQTNNYGNDILESKGLSQEVLGLLESITDKEENDYLREALGCWENKFYKAAVVLMWCATIDRIHRVIEQIGFDKFNQASEYMKNQTTGRFKRFNKNQNVHSISELRMVFDSDILAILEEMEMIDVNQRTRLASCFEMRCHSGHPGEAPITKYNVLSCFSDVVEIVFTNPKFLLNNNESEKDK